MGEFDYEGGTPSILDVCPVMSAAQLLAFLLKCVDRCELSLHSLQLVWLMFVWQARFMSWLLELTDVDCHLCFQKVHHMEEGAEVVVVAEAEIEAMVHTLHL